jgi:hypothetical protein
MASPSAKISNPITSVITSVIIISVDDIISITNKLT